MRYNPPKVSCKYGAPMGRYSDPIERFADSKVHLQIVSINSGGYDSGGAYWGTGIALWCVWNDEYVAYFRAMNRRLAKEQLPKTTKFYR